MKTLSKTELMTKTGDLGERLVARYYRNKGVLVEESLDLFDSKKDMLVDSQYTCEVKTQQLWHKENSFTIKQNQIQKCLSVDILIFVETPTKYMNKVNIYEFTKENRQTRSVITKDGRIMYLFSKKNATLLESIDDDLIVSQFRDYTNSTWNK